MRHSVYTYTTRIAELTLLQHRLPTVINVKTAKALGLMIPQSLLQRADELQ